MLSSIWNFIKNPFRKTQEPPVVKAVSFPLSKKQASVPPHPPRSLLALKNIQLKEVQEEVNAQYRLVLEDTQGNLPSRQKQQELQLHADIIDEVRQLSEQLEKLIVSEANLLKQDERLQNLLIGDFSKAESIKIDSRRQFELKKQYKEEIADFLELRYSKQLSEYPRISIEDYSMIRDYWKSRNRGHSQIKTTGYECVQKLTYKALGGLYFGEWLNDDMMQKRFIRESINPYRILNSYFATNTLTKTETQIQRVLKKKALDKGNILIMPVNNRNHWYFSVFEDGEIVVYDSMKNKEQYYLDNPIFKNALKFARFFYGKQYKLVVRGDYPQQDNCYDCGVFLLMGIRDILRKKQWSFHQGDIRFKRIQIAHEVLEETLIYTQ